MKRWFHWMVVLAWGLSSACGDDGVGEGVPEGGFASTRGDPGQTQSSSGDSTTSSDGSSSSGSGSASGVTSPSETGSSTQAGDVGSTTTTTTTDGSGGVTSVDSSTGDDDSATVPMAACGDGRRDDDEVCFLPFIPVAIGGGIPVDADAGDFDGDGFVDLAVIGNMDEVRVVFGDGNGGFGTPRAFPVGDGPIRVRAGDLDGDDLDDLVVVDQTDDTFTVLIANGSGGFSPGVPYAVGSTPVDVDVGDMTGDGAPDVLVGNRDDATYHIAVNQGDGTFSLMGPWPTSDGDEDPIAVTGVGIGSYGEAPGQPFPAIDPFFAGGMGWGAAPGLGDGSVITSIVQNGGGAASALGRVDVGNLDGAWNDVVIVDENRIWVLLGIDLGLFDGTPRVASRPSEVLLRDVTGEGDDDVIVANRGSDDVAIYVGDGTGGLRAIPTIPVGSGPSGLAIGDFNGDGVNDIATCNADATNVSVLLSAP